MLTSCEYSARIVQLFRAIIDGGHRDDCDDDVEVSYSIAQCAFWVLRWPCGQNGPVYATGPYYVAHVVDTGP